MRRMSHVVLILVHLFFILEILAPDVVWCHHPDGRAHLECQFSDSYCPCEPHQRLREDSAPAASGPMLNPVLSKGECCWHETLQLDSDRTSLQGRVGDAAVIVHPAVQDRPAVLWGPEDFSAGSPASAPPFPVVGGLAAIQSLRC